MKILVPIDISEKDQALFNFIRDGIPSSAEIRLLHVLQYPILPGNYLQPMDHFAEMFSKIKKMTREKMDSIATGEALAAWGGTVTTEIVDDPGGDIGELVSRYGKENEMDLVLLISRHRKGLDNVFAGSHLMRIIRGCELPMLVMSPELPKPIHRIGYATDFSEESAKVLQRLSKIAGAFKAGLTCYRVNTIDDFIDQRKFVMQRNDFINATSMVNIPDIVLYNAWDLESGILNAADDHACDVIAMATHGRTGFSRIFNGSVTEQIVKATHNPVLIMNLSI